METGYLKRINILDDIGHVVQQFDKQNILAFFRHLN